MYGYLERTIVTLAVLASFVVIDITGHMTSQMLTVYGPLMGAVAVAWFSGHVQQTNAATAAAQVTQIAAVTTEKTPSTAGMQ